MRQAASCEGTSPQSRRDFLASLGAAALIPAGQSLLGRLTAALPVPPAPSMRFKIRTITAGVTTDGSSLDPVHHAIAMLRAARSRVEAAGFVVEGVRVTTSPFVADVAPASRMQTLADLQALDRLAVEEKVGLSVGPVLRADRYDPGLPDWLVELAHTTRRLNFMIVTAAPDSGLHREAVRTASETVLALARGDPTGAANFRFAAIASMPPGAPFFPGGYHDGAPSFSIGLESPLLVQDAFEGAADASSGESRLRDSMNELYTPLEQAATAIASDSGYAYLGIDSSPAPSLTASIATALEALTHVPFGSASTLAACAAVTGAIKSLSVRTCGYSGLMLPVLEDPVLATRAREGRYGVRELLLYSSVCGTGLDTVPIPGDIPAERIARVLEDVATMSLRLHKPLAARLMPAIGKRAGEPVQFAAPGLAPSAVLEVV